MNHVHLLIVDVSLRLYDSVDCLISTYKSGGGEVVYWSWDNTTNHYSLYYLPNTY